MAFPQSQNFDAQTTGATVDAAMLGCDTIVGSASSLVVVPGLDGSTKAWRVLISTSGSRSGRSTISAQYTTARFRFKTTVNPDGVMGIVRATTGGGSTQQALVYLTTGGVIKMRSTGTTLVADNTDVYTDGTEYDVHYELDRTNKLQTLWITSDGGYYKQMGPVATGATSATEIAVGVCSTVNTADMKFDDYRLDNTQITPPSPPSFSADLISAIVGGPSEFGFTVQLETTGVEEVRLLIDPSGAATPTDAVTAVQYDSDSYASTPVEWNGAIAQTTYEWQAQGRVTAGAGSWVDLGDPGTGTSLPLSGTPAAEVRMAVTVCEFPAFSTRATWDVILASDATYWLQLGDWVYADDLTTNPELRRRYLLDVLQDKPGMADVARSRTLLGYTASDHDRTNQSVTSDPSIGAAIAAQEQVIPNPTFVTFASEEATCATVQVGRDLFILCDPRTEDREEGTSRGGGPDALLWGPEQEAWIFEQIRRTDVDFRFLVHEMPMVGDPEDITPKDDHGANYPDAITRLGDVMREMDTLLGRSAGFVLGGDYHALGLWLPGQHSNIPWGGIVGGGTANDSGNGRDPQNYHATFAFNDDTADGTPIAVYWKLVTTDDGTERSLLIKGWNAFDDELADPGLEFLLEWSSEAAGIQEIRPITSHVRRGWIAKMQGADQYGNVHRRSDSEEQVFIDVHVPPGNVWGDPDIEVDLIPVNISGETTETLVGTVVGSTTGQLVVVKTTAIALAAGTWDVVLDTNRPQSHPRLDCGQIVSH